MELGEIIMSKRIELDNLMVLFDVLKDDEHVFDYSVEQLMDSKEYSLPPRINHDQMEEK